MYLEEPIAVVVSAEDGHVMISAIFKVPFNVSEEDFLHEAIKSTEYQLKRGASVGYSLKVENGEAYVFYRSP